MGEITDLMRDINAASQRLLDAETDGRRAGSTFKASLKDKFWIKVAQLIRLLGPC